MIHSIKVRLRADEPSGQWGFPAEGRVGSRAESRACNRSRRGPCSEADTPSWASSRKAKTKSESSSVKAKAKQSFGCRFYLIAFFARLGFASLDRNVRASLPGNVGANLAGMELTLTGRNIDTDLRTSHKKRHKQGYHPHRLGSSGQLTSLISTVQSLRGMFRHFSTSSQTLTGRSLHTCLGTSTQTSLGTELHFSTGSSQHSVVKAGASKQSKPNPHNKCYWNKDGVVSLTCRRNISAPTLVALEGPSDAEVGGQELQGLPGLASLGLGTATLTRAVAYLKRRGCYWIRISHLVYC